jgi:AcrR family transcriptional regulator
MGRWEPDAEGRFRAAAIELFGEIGYEQTTVAAIATRAGLTARTFFRYFTDKREVLFKGSERLQQTMVDALASAPADASAIGAIATALAKAGDFFDDERRPFARLRNAVIAANTELHERELIKMARLSAALAKALGSRGVGEADASLAAEAGIAVFRVAFAQWVNESERRDYGEIVNESIARLATLTAGERIASKPRTAPVRAALKNRPRSRPIGR